MTNKDTRYAVSRFECLAMQLLKEDGWTMGEVCLAFERHEDTVVLHWNDDCEYHQGGIGDIQKLADDALKDYGRRVENV